MDDVFRALADPTRRALLDQLFASDGQPLVALTAAHDMTRIAVAKHLKILEGAGLVVTRRRGREKLHYLNPIPIRMIHDRWVSKYAGPWAAGLAGLKRELEETDMSATTITDVGTIGIPVSDQDDALAFFVGTLGFEKRLDVRISENLRWVTVAAPGASTSVALVARGDSGTDTGIRFMVPDAEAEHAALLERDVEVGELLKWPGVPPMFSFKDRDGNTFEIVETPPERQ
ncbi:MAG TPA: metalloregulator ArsR/SmtB family transcription factor [Streptosporangiaceae bacterium]